MLFILYALKGGTSLTSQIVFRVMKWMLNYDMKNAVLPVSTTTNVGKIHLIQLKILKHIFNVFTHTHSISRMNYSGFYLFGIENSNSLYLQHWKNILHEQTISSGNEKYFPIFISSITLIKSISIRRTIYFPYLPREWP